MSDGTDSNILEHWTNKMTCPADESPNGSENWALICFLNEVVRHVLTLLTRKFPRFLSFLLCIPDIHVLLFKPSQTPAVFSSPDFVSPFDARITTFPAALHGFGPKAVTPSTADDTLWQTTHLKLPRTVRCVRILAFRPPFTMWTNCHHDIFSRPWEEHAHVSFCTGTTKRRGEVWLQILTFTNN